jgi:hypothetical protein
MGQLSPLGVTARSDTGWFGQASRGAQPGNPERLASGKQPPLPSDEDAIIATVIYDQVDFPDAVVTLEEDSRKNLWYTILNIIDGLLSMGSGRTDFSIVQKIVVTDRNTGEVRWSNGGYRQDVDPEGCFQEICDEVEHFGLEQFVRRHTPGYFSR